MYPVRRNQASILVALGIWLLFILAVSSGETLQFRTALGQQQDQQNIVNSTVGISNHTEIIGNVSSPLLDSQQQPRAIDSQKGIAVCLLI